MPHSKSLLRDTPQINESISVFVFLGERGAEKMTEQSPKGTWKKNISICEKRGHHEYPIADQARNKRSNERDRVCVDCGFTVKAVA